MSRDGIWVIEDGVRQPVTWKALCAAGFANPGPKPGVVACTLFPKKAVADAATEVIESPTSVAEDPGGTLQISPMEEPPPFSRTIPPPRRMRSASSLTEMLIPTPCTPSVSI